MKTSGSCHSLRLTDSQALWEEVELDGASQAPQPRWRHTATLVSHNGMIAFTQFACTLLHFLCKHPWALTQDNIQYMKLASVYFCIH